MQKDCDTNEKEALNLGQNFFFQQIENFFTLLSSPFHRIFMCPASECDASNSFEVRVYVHYLERQNSYAQNLNQFRSTNKLL